MKKKHCLGDCNFRSYYQNQAGQGYSDINVFRGSPYQRGYGIGSLFKRFGIPIVKFLGKHLLRTGMQVGSDVLTDNLNKQTLKKRLKEGATSLAKESISKAGDFVEQHGSGRRLYKKRSVKRMKKSDIFQ